MTAEEFIEAVDKAKTLFMSGAIDLDTLLEYLDDLENCSFLEVSKDVNHNN